MKWTAISGSWRRTNPNMERDVRSAVASVMLRGDGIVTGGALGVDHVATREALEHNPEADRIRIIIPTTLDVYAAHYRNRAREGVITSEQAEALIDMLTAVKRRRPESLSEMNHTILNQETYYDRNTKVLEQADELLVFQANNSQGTQDAIDKAKVRGIPVTVKHYDIVD